MEKILFTGDGENVEFYVLEETRINGVDYILVTESDDEESDADCYILKDVSKDGDAEAVYEAVEDDNELDIVMRVFEELLEDTDIVK
ncbi:MAG: DUF1292 domain-containing protein [Lachnospiraceae bacterium]